MYDRILLPTDGSPGMANAIEQCILQAKGSGATIYTLYVVDRRSFVMLPEETQSEVIQVLEQEGSESISAIEALATENDVDVVGVIREGVPHRVILDYADEEDVDLIVMGTHGRTGEAERIVGSVAEEVVRHARVPVMTVRMTEAAPELRIEPAAEEEEEEPRYIE